VVFSAKSETPAASALPDIAIDRRAEDPLGKLKNHLAGFPGRVLLLAESAGRRETLATMLAEHGLKPAASADFAGFAAADAPLALGSAAAWRFCPAPAWPSSSPKPSSTPARRAAPGAKRRARPASTTG
jgi:transcription-repair coupling factor (superfamily II helicase)